MEANITPWTLFFIAAAAQGAFLSVILLMKRANKNQVSQSLLTLLVFAFTITLAYYITYWTGINAELPGYLRIILNFPLLFGPVAWLYLFVTLKRKWPQKLWLHFIPFVLASLLLLTLTAFSDSSGMQLSSLLLSVLPTVHLIIYTILNFRLAQQHAQNKWARNISFSFAGYVLCFVFYHLLEWTELLVTEYDYMVSLGMSAFIYYIGYHGFKTPPGIPPTPDIKYQKSSLTDNSIDYIIQKLDKLMAEEKLFTDGDLKLQEVADKLDVTVHALSQAINVAKCKKFTDYLNELRVTEATRLMENEEYKEAKLMAIAIDSGFNNKTSFLNAFKKQTGQTPSQCRKELQEETPKVEEET